MQQADGRIADPRQIANDEVPSVTLYKETELPIGLSYTRMTNELRDIYKSLSQEDRDAYNQESRKFRQATSDALNDKLLTIESSVHDVSSSVSVRTSAILSKLNDIESVEEDKDKKDDKTNADILNRIDDVKTEVSATKDELLKHLDEFGVSEDDKKVKDVDVDYLLAHTDERFDAINKALSDQSVTIAKMGGELNSLRDNVGDTIIEENTEYKEKNLRLQNDVNALRAELINANKTIDRLNKKEEDKNTSIFKRIETYLKNTADKLRDFVNRIPYIWVAIAMVVRAFEDSIKYIFTNGIGKFANVIGKTINKYYKKAMYELQSGFNKIFEPIYDFFGVKDDKVADPSKIGKGQKPIMKPSKSKIGLSMIKPLATTEPLIDASVNSPSRGTSVVSPLRSTSVGTTSAEQSKYASTSSTIDKFIADNTKEEESSDVSSYTPMPKQQPIDSVANVNNTYNTNVTQLTITRRDLPFDIY